jgi:tetratricopeptide (TPR) repeat protein
MYRQLNRLDEAIEAYNQAITLEPAYAWAYHNLGLAHEEQGNYETAIDNYRKAIDRHGNNEHKAILWDKVGTLYRLMNEPERAIEAYRQATTLDPKYASPWYNLGNIYATLGRSEAAIAAYRKAIALNPADPWPYHLLALVYESREEYGEAVTLYKQAIERHQSDRDRAISWDTLGSVYHDQGRLKEAQHAFQEALRLNPDYALPWNSLGDVYVALRDYEQAAEAYRKAIALDPTYAWPYNNLGVVYEKLGRYDQAIGIFQQVIARHTDKRDLAVSWHNLGDIYGLLAREEEAIGAYEQAIRVDPDYTWPYNSLGVLYEKRGDNEQAYVLYQEATRRHKQKDASVRN